MSTVLNSLIGAAPQAAGSIPGGNATGRARDAAAVDFGPLLARVLGTAAIRTVTPPGVAAPDPAAQDPAAPDAETAEATTTAEAAAAGLPAELAAALMVPATAVPAVTPPLTGPAGHPAPGVPAATPPPVGAAGHPAPGVPAATPPPVGAAGHPAPGVPAATPPLTGPARHPAPGVPAATPPLTGPASQPAPGGADASVAAAGAAGPSDPPGAAAPVDPRRVERALERLDPAFRSRMERVIERMRSEHGHEVKVVETLRPQDRQDFLYEQGRTRPGPVVTWTRSSNHTLGRAADVMIDGTYNNPAGYAQLAKIAAEEGLRTLGPRDPGHVELPRGAKAIPSLAAPTAPTALEAVQSVRTPAQAQGSVPAERMERGIARVAEVARVADVARVAQVAQVAQPGRVFAAEGGARAGQDPQRQTGGDGRDGARAGMESELVRLDPGVMAGQTSAPSGAEAVSGPGGVDAASRLARIMEVRDGAAAGPMSHVLLRMDNGRGGEDVIRVDLRGNAVGASIDLANAGETEQMLSRLPELQRALQQHGLETEQLRVRSAAAGMREVAELVQQVISTADVDASRGGFGTRTGSDSSSSRDRWEHAAQEQARRDADDPRQQSRRNPKGENKS